MGFLIPMVCRWYPRDLDPWIQCSCHSDRNLNSCTIQSVGSESKGRQAVASRLGFDELLAGLVGARGRGRDPEQHGDGHEEEPRGDEQRPEEGQHGAEPRPERGDRDGGRGHERHQGRALDPVLPH